MKRGVLEVLAGVFAIAIVLGWLGPRLDAPTRSYASYGYTPEQLADHHQLEDDARERCARDRGDNAGVIITADGAIVCTDKRGRRGKHQITIAVKSEAP